MKLSHEKLDVYQVSIKFLAWSVEVLESLPRGNASLSDQLHRACLSIPLNIAEAVGKTTGRDRARFFAIARGSALECAAVIDACCALKLVDTPKAEQGKELVRRVVSMLSKLCR